ncbi:MAG TPA: ankyrin repeat domain-containing protein [Bacteroidetes bacterium]|nr:ankyrin repeat domain-containing protein [Bacteroidota bacterium]
MKKYIGLFILIIFTNIVWGQDSSKNKKLFNGAERGNIHQIQKALDKGANIEARNSYGRTPLMIAAKKGRFEAVKYLIENGADINATNEEYSIITYASSSKQNSLAIQEYLLENGAIGKTIQELQQEYCDQLRSKLKKGMDCEKVHELVNLGWSIDLIRAMADDGNVVLNLGHIYVEFDKNCKLAKWSIPSCE